ncbi:immunoglobulin superfamily member 2 [Triplophysa dalaica]|uniref:immunoglobulin superfamily member 2 n=1 Tax=Triplophysa dalaica TaxID=1582913 RepID=UPI0024DFA60D|nr:immunoglobulin superfamily member 2 [Triplophysa dalaica]
MRRRMSVVQIWHLFLCLTGLLQWDVCSGQYVVHIQKGPLYRVKGFPMSLSCNVSGFKKQLVQDFQFTVNRDSSPIHMISTHDPNFPYAVFLSRVQKKEIEIERLTGSSVLLKINSLEMDDAGVYYCHTPNKDDVYHGTYEAETTLFVVEDTLVASYSGSASVSASEGDSLPLLCQVSTQTFQHTHVSVSWFLQGKDTDPRPIISLDRDLTVRPGAGFEERYRSGLIRMDKVNDTTFRLKMLEVRRSDSGNIYCHAIQWIQDPDHLWKQIAQKTTNACHVHITAVESKLSAVILMEKDHVIEGERLRVICSVSGFTGPLSVSWQHKKDSEESFSDIIGLTHDGVTDESRGRNIQTFRSSGGNITLDINDVMTADAGQYKCIVTEWIIQNNGMRKKANTQSQKDISVKAVDLQVTLKSRDTKRVEDSPVELICAVKGPKTPLSVNWMFIPSLSPTWRNIVSINHTGEIIWGSEQRNYQLSVQIHSSRLIFTLRIPRSSRQEQGNFTCVVNTYQKNIQKTSKNSNLLAVMVQKPDSKLTLSIPRSSLESSVNADVKMECSVTKATTNSSRFKLSWMFKSQMLLTMDTDAVVRFGPAAGLEMTQRFRMEKSEKQTFVLSIHQVRTSDSGEYRCEVEEWLQDPLGDWYPLGKKSDSTMLHIRDEESGFRMNKAKTELKVREGEPLTLKCSVDGVGSDSTLRYSLFWFNQNLSSSVPLITYTYDGRLKYNDNDEGRFHFSSSEVGSFLLVIPRSLQEDSGHYYCQVDQYQLDCKGQWTHKASDTSGSTDVSVHPLDSKLHVQKENRSLNVANLQAGFTVDCLIDTRSSDMSVFEVTWSRGLKDESPVIIFKTSRDGTLHSAMSDKELLFGHPNATHYKLSVPNIRPSDVGLYRCHVVEWIQTAPNHWRRIGEDASGGLSVSIEPEDEEKEIKFTTNTTDRRLDIKEGDSFELTCSLNVLKEDPTLRYTLSWVFNSLKSSSGISLLEYLNDGRLEYHEENKRRKNRFIFSRPSLSAFRLVVLNSDRDDDVGQYYCMIHQYQLNCDGTWKQTTSGKSGVTTITVHNIESKLLVQKQNQTLNITKLPADFTINCEITSWSSDKSAFEVTWFKVHNQDQPISIFTAKRDGTFDIGFSGKNLVFGRPGVRYYTLSIRNINPADMGQYYCQVDEWLLTSANIWKNVASDRSGETSVHVHNKDETEKQTDPLGTSLGVLIPIICFLALIIVILLIREYKRNSDLKKKKECLWAENHPLNPVKTDAGGDQL